jgi:hypothetical protein
MAFRCRMPGRLGRCAARTVVGLHISISLALMAVGGVGWDTRMTVGLGSPEERRPSSGGRSHHYTRRRYPGCLCADCHERASERGRALLMAVPEHRRAHPVSVSVAEDRLSVRGSTASLLGVYTHQSRAQSSQSTDALRSPNASLHHHLKHSVGSDDASPPNVTLRVCSKSILPCDVHESTTGRWYVH